MQRPLVVERPPPRRDIEEAFWRTMLCVACDVTWRGNPAEPCWSCGSHGSPVSTTLV